MNPNSSRMFPPVRNYRENPPAYGSYESPPHHNGPTMRLLPTTGADEEVDVEEDEDLHEGASTYQFESEYPDDDGQSRYAYFYIICGW